MIDIDREALDAARQALGTTTIRDTVNEALRAVARARIDRQLAALADYPGDDAEDFIEWRRSRDKRLGAEWPAG